MVQRGVTLTADNLARVGSKMIDRPAPYKEILLRLVGRLSDTAPSSTRMLGIHHMSAGVGAGAAPRSTLSIETFEAPKLYCTSFSKLEQLQYHIYPSRNSVRIYVIDTALRHICQLQGNLSHALAVSLAHH